MPTPRTVTTIRAYLSQNLSEAHARFKDLLLEAQARQDVNQVRRLVEAAEPLRQKNAALQKWHRYAIGFLELRVEQRPTQALSHLEALRSQLRQLPPGLGTRVLNGLGIVYEMSERWDVAIESYQACITLCEQEDDKACLGKALYNLAIVHFKGGDFLSAIRYSQRSINLLQAEAETYSQQIDLGRAWNEWGMAQKAQGNLAEAQTAFEQYRDISQRWDYHYGLGIAYNNLADTCRLLTHFDEAIKFYRLARNLCFEVRNLFEAAEATYGLGLVQAAISPEASEAEQLFDEALTLAIGANNHEIITQIYLSKAALAECGGDHETALNESYAAVNSVESLRANIAIPEVRIRLQGTRIAAYEALFLRLQAQADQETEAFHYAEQSKSRVFIELLNNRPLRPPQNIPAHLLAEEADLRSRLRNLYEQEPATAPERVIDLETTLSSLRQQLLTLNKEYSSFQTVSSISLDHIQQHLPEKAVLLEFFTANDQIYVFVITDEQVKIESLPMKASDLKQNFRQTDHDQLGYLRHLVRDEDGRLRTPWILHKLYQVLLEPLGDIIWQASLLCIIPHGILHYIPFHALYRQTATGIQYLSEAAGGSRPILYGPSATVLFDYCQQKPFSQQKGGLSLGYNGDLLVDAEAEAEQIGHILGGRAFVDKAATRATLLAYGHQYRYLHLACHGAFDPVWPMSSSISLADGPLDLNDILQNLYLEAELVTLSACETGRGHILGGDELIGLVRAFLYAGTPSVLVSQWVVDDLSTSLLMAQFYQRLDQLHQANQPAHQATALTEAQMYLRTMTLADLKTVLKSRSNSGEATNELLDYLARSAGYPGLDQTPTNACLFAHPYYWAPFFLVGDRL